MPGGKINVDEIEEIPSHCLELEMEGGVDDDPDCHVSMLFCFGIAFTKILAFHEIIDADNFCRC